MMGEQSEDEAILRAQQLDLIYSPLAILYKILPNAPRAEMDPMRVTPIPHANRVIDSMVI